MTDTPAPYENRIGGLRFFGILLLGLAVLAALFGGVSLLAVFVAGGAGLTPARMMIPSVAFYVLAALYLGTLGVGSYRARRWARSLSLATGWLWLATGVLTALMMAFILPRTLETLPDSQPGVGIFVAGCMVAVVGVFFILVPLAMVLFFRRPAVRATVERLDPLTRWTDPLPISVLAFVLLWAWAAVSCVMAALVYPVLPIGSMLIRGVALVALMLAMAALSSWVAWGTVRRLPAAWWTAVALLALGAVTSFALLPSTDFTAWYEAMEMPMDPAQIAMMNDLYSSPWVLGMMAVAWVAYLGWVLSIRPYFFAPRRLG